MAKKKINKRKTYSEIVHELNILKTENKKLMIENESLRELLNEDQSVYDQFQNELEEDEDDESSGFWSQGDDIRPVKEKRKNPLSKMSNGWDPFP